MQHTKILKKSGSSHELQSYATDLFLNLWHGSFEAWIIHIVSL